MDRLWGANMNYRTEVIRGMRFDENFQRYGLYEDVDFSVRVGQTHRLALRVDAEVFHDTTLGQTTRPAEGRYFLMSWANSTYVIEKLFPCSESRKPHERLFKLTEVLSTISPESVRTAKSRTLGDPALFAKAREFIDRLRRASDRDELEKAFLEVQAEVLAP